MEYWHVLYIHNSQLHANKSTWPGTEQMKREAFFHIVFSCSHSNLLSYYRLTFNQYTRSFFSSFFFFIVSRSLNLCGAHTQSHNTHKERSNAYTGRFYFIRKTITTPTKCPSVLYLVCERCSEAEYQRALGTIVPRARTRFVVIYLIHMEKNRFLVFLVSANCMRVGHARVCAHINR